MGLFNHHQEEKIAVDGQVVSISEFVNRYNQLGQKLEEANQQVSQLKRQVASLQERLTSANQSSVDMHKPQQSVTTLENQLQKQLATNQRLLQEQDNLRRQLSSYSATASSTLLVDGQEMTAADVQTVVNQWQATADQANAQLQELKTENAKLKKVASQASRPIKMGDQSITVDELIDHYNNLLKKLRRARQQLQHFQEQRASQSVSLKVNGQALTVDDVQNLIKQRQDANDRLKKATDQLKILNRDLTTAKQVTVDDEIMSVAELVERYRHLLQQRQFSSHADSHPAPRSQNTQPVVSSAPADTSSSQEKLIDRYYQVVQAVLGEYQDQIARLQRQLTEHLKDNGQVEFLQLTESSISPSSYQKIFLERNQQMVRYIENHQHQEELVRPEYQEQNPHDEMRGVRYWGNFVFRYRKTLTSLLNQNRDVHRNFKYAYHYAKTTAKRIGESKPSYLSDQNVVDLRTIHSGIKDEQAWKNDMKEFQKQANNTLKGATGERLVRNVVATYNYNRVLTSLNLPYQYEKGKDNSNQIDCIVVNQKGIFILEIKNYAADSIGIDQNGFIVTERGGKTYQNAKITRQGQLHYKAVLKNLAEDEMTKPYLSYLKHQLHVLYVSTNPHTEIKPVYPNANPYYHFIGLDGLRKYIDSTKGQLRPEVIRSVVEAIDNRQQAEKRYDYFCFPADPDKRAEAAWQQYTIMRQLIKLKLDDFVDRYDPDIRQELNMAGLQACDGYVTSKPHR